MRGQVPLSEAKARLSELARRVRQQHERVALTRNSEAEVVLLSVDGLEGLEMDPAPPAREHPDLSRPLMVS